MMAVANVLAASTMEERQLRTLAVAFGAWCLSVGASRSASSTD